MFGPLAAAGQTVDRRKWVAFHALDGSPIWPRGPRPVRIGRRVLLEEGELERFVAGAKESGEPEDQKEKETKNQ